MIIGLGLVAVVFGVAVLTDLNGISRRIVQFLTRSRAKAPGRVQRAYYKLWARIGGAVLVAVGVVAIKIERG